MKTYGGKFWVLLFFLLESAFFYHAAAGVMSDTLPVADYTVKISGRAQGAEGREIVWRSDADAFTPMYVELGRAKIDDSGYFTLTTDLVTGIMPTYLVIDYYSTALFVEAGHEYILQMAGFDYYMDEKINAFIVSDQLPSLQYLLLDKTGERDTADRNSLLSRYSLLYGRMLQRDFERINIKKDIRPVANFIKMADSLFSDVRDTFFNAYRAYTEAGLKDFSGMASRKELYRDYIENRPVDAYNPAQVEFLKNYYLDYFASNRFLPLAQTRRMLNRNDISDKVRLEMLSDSMGLDYSLRSEVLREWVLIYACTEIWNDASWNGANLRSMLEYLARNTKFVPHARAIRNFLDWKDKSDRRNYFTGISLCDTLQDCMPIDSLLEEGKFHYFVFVRADYARCPTCGEESKRLATVWEKLSAEERAAVKIIYVNCDYAYPRYYHDAKKNRYPWLYLHFNGHIDWIRTIDAARFPAYILVDDKGSVLNAGFNAPSQNIEEVFKRMAKLKGRRDRQKSDSKDTR